MARQIIKQPNGKYLIFDTISDSVIHTNLEKKEIIDLWVQESTEQIIKNVDNITEQLDKDLKPYFQFTISYEEVLKIVTKEHGIIESKQIELLTIK